MDDENLTKRDFDEEIDLMGIQEKIDRLSRQFPHDPYVKEVSDRWEQFTNSMYELINSED